MMIGQILINEKKYDQAIAYLDTSLYIWDGFGYAWSELMYANILKGNLSKAKNMGLSALKNNSDVGLDKPGQAAILRKLGYIAIEEHELDEAEGYYKKSLENDESDVARKELKSIEEMRKHKK